MKIGIDIANQSELINIINSEKYRDFLFTKNEIQYTDGFSFNRKLEFLTGRFCTKEAVVKALGIGFLTRKKVTWKDIEILKINNAPTVVLHNNVKYFFTEKGYRNIEVSITHKKETVISVVLIH
ncbi:holo-ACP synthase [Virgibacillus sp. C22-A2]|uniref:Holo-ACP synthase n=1 Tax=Virgibacillus tibetensis TaxID=3042313 RepID=A0ABU6KJC7_9BACI|nr:holo-ACP synthase [Virgibacillus sp. C22-A2]